MIPEKISSPKDANNSTIAIFIKLFATKIVANSFLGFDNNFLTIAKFPVRCLSDDSSTKSVAFNEKKEISAPEINAEQINNIIKTRMLMSNPLFIDMSRSKLGGSVSKIKINCY